MQLLGDSLLLAAVLFLVRFIAVEASYQRAKRTHSGFRYPVGVGLRVLFRVGGPLLIFVGYKMSEISVTKFDWVAAVAVALLGLGCIFGEPGEIETSPSGITLKRFIGIERRSIPWEGAAARHVVSLREVLIIGRDGAAITHSQYHVGQEQLVRELERHGVVVQA